MDLELLAIALTFFVHLIGAGILVWALIDTEEGAGSWRDWWPKDDPGPEPPVAPPPPGGTGADRPLLPDARPSAVRLRQPGRIGDHRPVPPRRPTNPAAPEQPARERERA